MRCTELIEEESRVGDTSGPMPLEVLDRRGEIMLDDPESDERDDEVDESESSETASFRTSSFVTGRAGS